MIHIDIIEKYWDERSSTFDEDHATEDTELWRSELQRLCNARKGLKVLDIGTGTGFLAIMLAELGHDVTGIDISEEMMELGKGHAREKGVYVEFVKGEGESMPFEDDTFDVIVNCKETYIKYLEEAGYDNPMVLDMDLGLIVKKEGKNGKPMQPWECVYGEKPM